MIHLLHLMPFQPGRVFYRVLELWGIFAVRYDVEPAVIAPVLGNPPFIGGKQDRPGIRRYPFNLDKVKLPGIQV
jgi:hypothetical protein